LPSARWVLKWTIIHATLCGVSSYKISQSARMILLTNGQSLKKQKLKAQSKKFKAYSKEKAYEVHAVIFKNSEL
jgi:hypothetical protein